MAGDLNSVILIGRLTRDPELRQTNTGSSLCRFSIANNRIYMQNEQRREEVSFFNCVAWGRQAEIIARYCHKGKQVAINGRIKQSTWQDNEGRNRSNVDVVVDRLQLLGSGPGGGETAAKEAVPVEAPSSSGDSASYEEPAYEGRADADDIPF